MSTGKVTLQRENGAPEIYISFTYSPELVAEVKNLPQRRWDGQTKTWILPATRIHAAAALTFARANNFECDPKLEDLAGKFGTADFTFQPSPPPGRTVTLTDDKACIRFPYNEDLIAEVKKIPSREWDKGGKVWTVPFIPDALEELLKFIEFHDFTGDMEKIRDLAGKLNRLAVEAIEASKAATADFEVEGIGGILRPFQKAGVKYAVEKKRVIIGDQPGLGKTIEALATVQAMSAYPTLVVCPATLKENWYREARKWLPHKIIQILGGIGRSDAAITIVNYDRLKDYRDYLVRRDFKAVICDESHLLKNPKTLRSVFTEEIVNGCIYERNGTKPNRRQKEQLRAPCEVRLLLTGTPVLNRPDELISQLRILDRLKEFGGWYRFTRDFCAAYSTQYGTDTSGAENLKVLHDKLRATCYVRRLKREVLAELPPKVRTVVPVELSNRSEYDRAERNLIVWLKDTVGEEKADAAARAEQLVRIEALKQLSARGKMAAIKEWVKDFLDTGEKIVLFGWHQGIVLDLARSFNCHAIYGDTPIPKRQPIIDAFQDNSAIRALALNIQTGGLGITLTAASDVLFAELGWNPATMDQGADRLHRIGQTDSVNEWWFIGKNTIDEDIQQLIEEKRTVVDATTDGKEAIQGVSVLNELISRLRNDQRGGWEDSTDEPRTVELF